MMDEERATTQDIRPMNIIILNLMPEKERTELQLVAFIGKYSASSECDIYEQWRHMNRKTSVNRILDAFYTTFEHVKHRRFDGLIITGAPIEHLAI